MIFRCVSISITDHLLHLLPSVVRTYRNKEPVDEIYHDKITLRTHQFTDTGCSGKIEIFPKIFKCHLYPWAAIGCSENGETIGVTVHLVHSHLEDLFCDIKARDWLQCIWSTLYGKQRHSHKQYLWDNTYVYATAYKYKYKIHLSIDIHLSLHTILLHHSNFPDARAFP